MTKTKEKEPKLIEVENGRITFVTTKKEYKHLFINIKG